MITPRRSFLKAGAFVAANLCYGQNIIGANRRIRIALVGCGGRGTGLIREFLKIPDVEIVAVSDPDTARMETFCERLSIGKLAQAPFHTAAKPTRYRDYRILFEQPGIDAVVIASPNYWHTLHAVHAMQAGKHVYLEKPVTFTLWEGLQLEAAEKKYGKIVAAGYQNRSDKGPQAGIRYVQEGYLGKIRKVRSLCYRNRDSIGKIDQPLAIPSTVDYDLWLGPAQDQPIYRPKLHYDWHWDFNTGCGDMGNQGVHEIDMVCWLLGDPVLPSEIRSFGNRFIWDDAGNTPNMLSTWFEMAGTEVIIETNDIKLSPTRNASPARMGTRVGIVAECENGILRGGRGGMVALEPDGKTIIRKFPGDGGRSHQRTFIDAILANDASLLPSRISTAITSASLTHLGNMSYRLGERSTSSETGSAVDSNADLAEILDDQQQQLASWGHKDPEYIFGRSIKVDPVSQKVLNPDVGADLSGPNYRAGHELQRII